MEIREYVKLLLELSAKCREQGRQEQADELERKADSWSARDLWRRNS